MIPCKYFPKKTLGYSTDGLWYLRMYNSSNAYEFSVWFIHAILKQDHMKKRVIK